MLERLRWKLAWIIMAPCSRRAIIMGRSCPTDPRDVWHCARDHSRLEPGDLVYCKSYNAELRGHEVWTAIYDRDPNEPWKHFWYTPDNKQRTPEFFRSDI